MSAKGALKAFFTIIILRGPDNPSVDNSSVVNPSVDNPSVKDNPSLLTDYPLTDCPLTDGLSTDGLTTDGLSTDGLSGAFADGFHVDRDAFTLWLYFDAIENPNEDEILAHLRSLQYRLMRNDFENWDDPNVD
ncbi:hypothetical protein niasHT_024896 [Heterodera trifolii]|uniref:Uncharacterized protein n=1 Tax=Heterodera trifolii TaxID=157864 RepID=A0ABD2JYJ8_9BILA